MVEAIPFLAYGFLLGAVFVELTYRFIGKGLIGFYLLSLPVKLLLWALAFLFCMSGISGILSCLSGFLFGFLLMLFLKGFRKYGRAESP